MAGGKDQKKKKAVKGAKASKQKAAAKKKRRSDEKSAAAAGGGGGAAAGATGTKASRYDQDPAAARARNPRAFTVASRGRAKIQRARTAEKEQSKMHAPAATASDAAAVAAAAGLDDEPPPFVVLVQGPPGVGKTTLIKALIKHYTRQSVPDPRGPVTVVAGKSRRLTLLECPQGLHAMADAAKIADLVLLLVDASYGFEMETFEFLNMLQVSGFPKVMGVLTHLDEFRDAEKLKKAKKALKHRFWGEVYAGAKLFYLSGMRHGSYPKREVLNLARFVSVMKFRPLQWRSSRAYLVADRIEDVTPPAEIEAARRRASAGGGGNGNGLGGDRTVRVFGYVRGAPLRGGQAPRLHVAGVGDTAALAVDVLPDPCPLPGSEARRRAAMEAAAGGAGDKTSGEKPARRRSLNDRERLIYAPMADVGRLLFDKDAVYVEIPDHKVAFTDPESALGGGGGGSGESGDKDAARRAAASEDAKTATTVGVAMVKELQRPSATPIDAALEASEIRLFAGGAPLSGKDAAGWGGVGGGGGSSSLQEQQQQPASKARVRRPAPVGTGTAFRGEDDDDDVAFESDEEGEEGGDGGESTDASSDDDDDGGGGGDDGRDFASDDDGDSDDEGLGAAARWKEGAAARVGALFATREVDLAALVYGSSGGRGSGNKKKKGAAGGGDDDDDDDDDELFKPRGAAASSSATAAAAEAADPAAEAIARAAAADDDVSAPPLDAAALRARWGGDDGGRRVEGLRNRFVTGDWSAAADRGAARPGGENDGDGDDDDEVFGDFEDVEAATAGAAEDLDPALAAARRALSAVEDEERKLAEAKEAKKAAFDAAYDSRKKGGRKGGGKGGGSGEGSDGDGDDGDDGGDGASDPLAGGARTGRNRHAAPGFRREDEAPSFYDEAKAALAARAARTAAALAALPAERRAALGGVAVGSYARLTLRVPAELVEHWDPRRPLVVGALTPADEAVGGTGGSYLLLRLKRHRWHPGKVLKTRDPLVVSVGWRRAQVVPVFATEDANGRHRALKYTPEHAHCLAYAWFAGGAAPAGTGVLCFQAGAERAAGWRVAATGAVLGGDAAPRVVKKLKLVGEPSRVHRRTAFVRGLFNSQLEAARFEGAAVRTASGVRGIVKRAASARAAARAAGGGGKGGDAAAAGVVRATFEDKILISDIVFLRAWVAVDLPRLCIPVTDLLCPASARRAAALAGRREPKRGREGRSDSGVVEVDDEEDGAGKKFSKSPPAAVVAPPPAAVVAPPPAAAAFDAAEDFVPCSAFAGPRPGWFFGTRGGTGTGYFRDDDNSAGGGKRRRRKKPSPSSSSSLIAPATPGRAPGAAGEEEGGDDGEQKTAPPSLSLGGVDKGGWVAMRTVAELRRAAQLAAPRDADSLYRPIERAAERRFNPLRVPRALQAALPFASKQKQAAPRKRKDLDARRAVALDKEGKRAASLVAQLNAIRNVKAAKRLAKQASKRAAHSEKVAAIEASRGARRKEERKRKFVEEGRKERAAAKKSRGGARGD